MALTPSTMLELGTPCPAFSLPDPEGRMVNRDDLAEAPALLVLFICNHCPYVIHVADELSRLGRDCAEWGVAVVGINSNDVQKYPADAPPKMAEEAAARGYCFPYLFDETQEIAQAFRAACTPEAYLFDGQRKLVYRGQLDDSRPGTDIPVTCRDVRAAIETTLAGRPVAGTQTPSVGCNIKWKEGNAPAYF